MDVADEIRLKQLEKEAEHWAREIRREKSRDSGDISSRTSWLDHPLILQHYKTRCKIEGMDWHLWAYDYLKDRANEILDLGCGTGTRTLLFLELGFKRAIGYDLSSERISEARDLASKRNFIAKFEVADVNSLRLEHNRFDLIISCHSFHHFQKLERIMAAVSRALKPSGLFILEEFVGPSLFQWSDEQLTITNNLLALLPEKYRIYQTGTTKLVHGRDTPEAVRAVSPFEAVRSSEIVPLFYKNFEVLHHSHLGGTIQHLLYAGIIHNFKDGDPDAERIINNVDNLESFLIARKTIPSDFDLIVGRKISDNQRTLSTARKCLDGIRAKVAQFKKRMAFASVWTAI